MTVQVKKVLDRILFMHPGEIFFNSVCLRRKLLDQELTPLPVKIKASQITPGRPVNNPIWIDHRNNYKLIFLQQHLNLRHRLKQIIDQSLAHKGTHSLTRMLPGSDQDGILVFRRVSIYLKRRNDIVSQRMSELFDLHMHTFLQLSLLQARYVLGQPRIRIGLVQRKIHLVIILLKIILKTQVIVSFS